MGKRARKRARSAAGRREVPTTSHPFGEDGSITLRDELSPGTLHALEKLEARPGASGDDRWQRRVELLFEHLVVEWEIAGLPLAGQRELLGRYRMASADERRAVREALAAHLAERYPDVEL